MKAWLVPLTDVETQSERHLMEAEIKALCGRLPTLGPLPAALRSQFSGFHSTPYCVELDPATVQVIAARAAYLSAILVEGDAPDGIPAKTVRRIVADRNRYSSVLPIQRVYEESALSTLRPVAAEYVAELVTAAWSRTAEGNGHSNGTSGVTRRKNDYLSHPLHKYKAKFFPRLCRAMINICGGTAIRSVADPMAGSGTTLAEAALLGIQGVGFDIDPLSVMIARAKAQAVRNTYSGAIVQAWKESRPRSRAKGQPHLFSRKNSNTFHLPSFVSRKLPEEEVREIERDCASLWSQVEAHRGTPGYDLFAIALSHAISTKISLRWMGTGDNRFSIKLAKRDLERIEHDHLRVLQNRVTTIDALTTAGLILKSPPPRVDVGDARKLPVAARSFDAVVTSPPYLPAASGRETYLRSRASALLALRLMSEPEILTTEERMLGTILLGDDRNKWCLPEEVIALVDWMRPQRARGPKAVPTLHYFESLRRVLQEIHRVLRPGGKCAIVLSARHQFYELVSRKTVRVFDMADVVAELATNPRYKVGLSHEETIEIVLPKMDYAARPASRHEYSEAVLILRRDV